MSEKVIQFQLGGRYQFMVKKFFTDDVERFSVALGCGSYGTVVSIAEGVTWAEASSAMNRFKDEFEDAFEVLVQASTLTPIGVHSEED